MSRHAKMSLETALDEERREVMDILEGRNPSPAPKNRRASPMPAVRSMLDISISTDAPPRQGSIAAPSSARGAPVRSLVDPPTPSPLRSSHSAATSPTSPQGLSLPSSRRASDGTNYPAADARRKPGVDIDTDYKFEMLPSIPNQALPKRVTQGGFTRGRDAGRHNSTTVGMPGHSSRSPSSSRLGRSLSPVDRLLRTSSLNLMSTPGKFVTENGKVIDMDRAYKRLSSAALARSGGSLSTLHSRKSSSRERGESGDSAAEDGNVRLAKDHYEGGEDGSEAAETSEEEADDTSSGEDDVGGVSRGRRRGRKKLLSDSGTTSEQSDGGGKDAAKEPGEPQILLAAAEKERPQVASTYKVKSLLDPEPTNPAKGNPPKPSAKKTGVHPRTSFDYTASSVNTPVGSDEEADLSDIKQAQNLSIHVSAIDNSVPNRAIRTIIRGDFTKIQKEADEGRRRQRKYLVATDLSEESVYALEWTIGTILRDGDTLFAVYAVDEETGTGSKDAELSSSVQIGEGAKVIQDTAAVVGSQTEKTAKSAALSLPHMLTHRGSGSDSKSGSVDSRGMSKAEMERFHAVEGITQTCVRLLRKTMLQVRVAVEVIHCKSPKHLITEAIDGLEPTLVILGSRGRSALKGVLLGSFSNYLVAKSSVPVMVARKKLKKHAKYKSTNIRLSNNLTTPKKLALAKVD